MKNILLLLGTILTVVTASAQSFSKGVNMVELDLGIGVYPNVTNNINYYGFTATNKGNASSSIIGLQYERGVSNVIGVGVRIASQKYLDSAGVDNTDAGSFDLGFLVNAHFVKTEKVDLYGTLTLGITNLNIDDNNSALKYEGSGSYANLGLGARFYLGSKFFLSPKFQFASMTVNGNYKNVLNDKVKAEWQASGTQFFIGAGIKF